MKNTDDNGGWITLHRKILKWEWYDDINVKCLFIHLLLTVNHEDRMWHGIEIKRGQRITGYPKLAKEIGLSVRQTRTALTKLKSTGEVTVTATSKFSIVTVANYGGYQSIDRQPDRQATGKRQADDRQATTNNNDNNITIKQLNKNTLPSFLEKLIEEFPTVDVEGEYVKAMDWVKSMGKVYKDYEAFMRNWCRRCVEKGTGLRKITTVRARFVPPPEKERRTGSIKTFREIMAEKALTNNTEPV